MYFLLCNQHTISFLGSLHARSLFFCRFTHMLNFNVYAELIQILVHHGAAYLFETDLQNLHIYLIKDETREHYYYLQVLVCKKIVFSDLLLPSLPFFCRKITFGATRLYHCPSPSLWYHLRRKDFVVVLLSA